LLPGVVVRAYGKWFEVALRDEPRSLLSTVRGTVRRERRRTDLVAVGDRVQVIDVGADEGQIEVVEPRSRALKRLARNTRDTEQVILANPDQVLFLFAVRHPKPHLRMLDRFLVLAESEQLPAMIGVNKVDLDDDAETAAYARELFHDYGAVYPVFYLSAATGRGIPELRAALTGKITAIAGPSGVGKSTLLNALDPAGMRETGDISAATGKGRHTTTAARLYRIDDDPPTFVADTPGMRALALHGIASDELDHAFPELRPYLGDCLYQDCTHLHEPGCAVREAVAKGEIPSARYESYASLRRGDAG
jgi:ribosome biogenesis GTPase